jgi:hypothetical protein
MSGQSTSEHSLDPALRRVLERAADALAAAGGDDAGGAAGAVAVDRLDLLDLLAERLSGADLTTLLLEVYRRRALRQSPAEVLRRYRTDRFVAPSPIPALRLRGAEDRLIAALPATFTLLSLAPLTPLATHTSVATVDPRKIVATLRGTEVAADPTNALSLEAADRRARLLARSPRSAEPVALAAVQRVVRAQRFEGPGMSAHFALFGLVTAGRDRGALAFEREALLEHLSFAADAVPGAQVRVTILAEPYHAVFESVRGALPRLPIVLDPSRETGHGYYTGLCFKVHADGGEIGDGGFTGWTARLLGNRKERQLISGYGVDRLA